MRSDTDFGGWTSANAGRYELAVAGGAELQVVCYAGHRGEETPRSFRLGERVVEVVEIIDRWIAPDHRYFKLLGDDEAIYIIRHDSEDDQWELVFYQAAGINGKQW